MAPSRSFLGYFWETAAGEGMTPDTGAVRCTCATSWTPGARTAFVCPCARHVGEYHSLGG